LRTSAPAALSVSKYQAEDSDQHPCALQRGQGPRERLGWLQADLFAQPGGKALRDLGGIQEQPRGAVGVQDGLSQRKRRADNVAAADVEQPGDRGRGGQHRGVRVAVLQAGAHPRALLRRTFAGVFQRMGHHRRLRLGRALRAPGMVEGIVIGRLQRGAGLGRGCAQPIQRVGTVQARVIADGLAGLQGGFEIGGDPTIDQVAHLEQGLVHLVAHLQGVAAVDEHRRLVLQDNRRPGRAGKAGGPGQPVIGRWQVLVLVLVLVWDQEPVQPLVGHRLADQRHVAGPKGGVCGFVERLAHVPI
jgi:hypothetical protein